MIDFLFGQQLNFFHHHSFKQYASLKSLDTASLVKKSNIILWD